MTVYLISDTHLDDPKIIEVSERKFNSVKDMNETIVDRWNDVVGESDQVLFGGDLSHSGAGKNGVWRWFTKLPSITVFLRGNHDPFARSELDKTPLPIVEYYEFTAGDQEFQCSHKPSGIADSWTGWGIHGHVHDNAPFIDADARRVNISADVIGYEPIPLPELLQYLESGESLRYRPHDF